jgi:putative ABC transport system ATP-binding protein
MSSLKLEKVKRFYNTGKKNEFRALKNINIDVKKGEFVGIIGPSGSGKSTLLNIIGCLDTQTEGKVYIEGQDISTLSSSERARIRREMIGFVFQQFNLVRSLTCIENVELPMEFAGRSRDEMKKRANYLLDLVGLAGKGSQIPSEMSGGEQQRVAIARALANNPRIILADEPTGNLDTKTGEKIIDLLIGLNRNENKTLVVITHDIKIAGMADRIVQLRDGEIV